jgi:hypothetical protein
LLITPDEAAQLRQVEREMNEIILPAPGTEI